MVLPDDDMMRVLSPLETFMHMILSSDEVFRVPVSNAAAGSRTIESWKRGSDALTTRHVIRDIRENRIE